MVPICAGPRGCDSFRVNDGLIWDCSRETLEYPPGEYPGTLEPGRVRPKLVPYEVGGMGICIPAVLGSVGTMGIIGMPPMLASVGATGILRGMDDSP